jgi:hypothetical protein
LFYKNGKNIFDLSEMIQTSYYEEVNCAEPSPSVRIPWEGGGATLYLPLQSGPNFMAIPYFNDGGKAMAYH